MRKIKLGTILLAAAVSLFVTCKKEESSKPEENQANFTAREQAVADYKEMYLGSAVSNFVWNGNASNCNPGTLPDDVLAKAFLRIKYFRKVAGISNSGISIEADLNAKCQKHALMTTANNNTLSHTPDASWKCYTADGADAAKNGNIAYGRSNVESVSQWMEDAGSNNTKVGHRRWILYSMATKYGFGCTQDAATMWVINNGSGFNLPASSPEFIAWPASGYIPRQVVYPRWSFAVPLGSFPFQVDFTNATVSMVNASGGNVPLTIVHKASISSTYVGDNTIVWEPTGINLSSTEDQKYTVTINGVMVNGVSKNYTYQVIIINP